MSQPLSGCKIIDLTGPCAYDCARILASFGAQVLRIDTPRQLEQRGSHPWRQHLWNIGNAGKRCEMLDYEQPAGREAINQHLAGADVLIESFEAAQRRCLGLDYPTVHDRFPTLIAASITTFGTQGPRSEWQGGELIAQALSGVLLTCGYPDRAPVREPLHANFFAACAAAAFAVVAARHQRRRTGLGQHVDLAAQEVGASRNLTPLIAYQFDRREISRMGPAYGVRGGARAIWALRDGYVYFTLMPGKFGAPANRALTKWLDDLNYENPLRGVDWDQHRPGPTGLPAAWEPAIGAFFADRTRHEIDTEGRRRGLTATSLLEAREVPAHPQLIARKFFDPRAVPRYFVHDGVIAGSTAIHNSQTALALAPTDRPLDGLKVLDFSWAIVGGTATKLLGDLGAQVIKIESAHRMGLERIVADVSVSVPGNPDDKPWFSHVNTSKHSMLLDLKNPASRAILERLIDWCDVVVENFSPGTMEKLGLSYEMLRARKPSIIMASGSVYGQTGPWSQSWGIDGTGAALSGRMLAHGWPDRTPVLPSAPYGDCVLPYLLMTALVAAIDHRELTGQGRHIDGAMFEVLSQQMLARIQDPGSAPTSPRTGNREPDACPHGVFRCAGDDCWIAIAGTDDTQWRALCQSLDLDELLNDPRLATLEGRKQHEDWIEQQLAARTCSAQGLALMQRLQQVGVPAAVVQSASKVFEEDPQIAFRGFYQTVPHPLLGPFRHQRIPVMLAHSAPRMAAAPRLGEHTRKVCLDWLGMDETAFATAQAQGVFT
jgi:crotonobetainyl-CoA:carnitine CoA-transferase CaiB-like acyl-CoA transferase